MAIDVINSLKFSDDTHVFSLPYGTCSTAAGTAAKVVTVDNFSLETSARVTVKFTKTNTATSPTLNVNSTGAKAIMHRGSAISAGTLAANRIYEFVYDGTDYELIGDIEPDLTGKMDKTNPTGTGYICMNDGSDGNPGNFSVTLGKYTDARGEASVALGWSTHATGLASYAEGTSTYSTNETSHSEGYETIASGKYSHAEGNGCMYTLGFERLANTGPESGTYILNSVEGLQKGSLIQSNEYDNGVFVISDIDVANNKITLASGTLDPYGWGIEDSSVICYTVGAIGDSSHTEGEGTTAASDNQHVQGKYNVIDNNDEYAHILGNGSSGSSRSNAHVVDWDGNAWFAGDVYVGSTSGTNKDDGSKKLSIEGHTHDYLPLTGGTINGNSGDTALNLKSNAVGSYLGFKNNTNTVMGYYGFDAVNSPVVYLDRARKVLHENNYSTYAMSKSGGTFTGAVVAQNNTNYTTLQVRNNALVANGGTAPTMGNGDITWFYE